MATNQELRATFINERRRWDETILATVKDEHGNLVTIKAQAEEDELSEGLEYLFWGSWKDHPKYGRQFAAKSWARVQPHDEHGIIAYLLRAPHVGLATAKALWKEYKGDAVKTLRENPEKAVEDLARAGKKGFKGFNIERAREAAAFLEIERATEDTTIELMNLLAGRGFPRKTLKAAIKRWGANAGQLVRKNPYLLMMIPGCGFLRADGLYLDQGYPPSRLKRQTLCMWNAIHSDMNGHTWFQPEQMESALREKVSSADVRAVDAARLGIRSGLLAVYRDSAGKRWITDGGRDAVEDEIAKRLAEMLDRAPQWPSVDDLDVSDHQREELRKALRGTVAILGGSPGTGKTHSAARVIGKICADFGPSRVAVCAPTGKAAVRITEALQGYGLAIKAKTIHSYLRVRANEGGGNLFTFERCEGNPVDEKYIVVDESSMIDAPLMAALLRALPADAHVLLVGDVQQLPPVGHGAPLRDLIAAGVPAGDLREIRRNSGLIVETCAKIRDKEFFPLPEKLNGDSVNLCLKRRFAAESSASTILDLLTNIQARGLADPIWETQVLVAVNENSALSRVELNKVVQAQFNGGNRSQGKFWPKDKIVCLRNGFWSIASDFVDEIEDGEDDGIDEGLVRTHDDDRAPEVYVANGEIGRVIDVFPNKIIMEFFAPHRVILVPKGDEGEPPFDLGYVISGHKSQGSEWPIVIVGIDDSRGAKMVCDRGWIYTAISRAKKACILVGQEAVVRSMVMHQKINQRKTFLVERLGEERFRRDYQKRSGGLSGQDIESQGPGLGTNSGPEPGSKPESEPGPETAPAASAASVA